MIFNAYQNSTDGLFGVSTVSAGHIFAHQGRTISRPTGRKDWLLFYIAKGSELFTFNSKVRASAGSFVIYRPDEKQMHIHDEDINGEFFYVHFTAPDGFSPLSFETSRVYNTEPSSEIRELFEEVINELHLKRASYEKLCVSKLFCILSLLERESSKKNELEKKYTDKISFVLHKMNTEYDKNESLDGYAALCNMSKFHFLRVFKDITGQSPLEYRNGIRLEHARQLLESTNASVSEISERLGYSSQNYFCDAFKRRFNMTPTQYRRTKNNG